MANKHHFRITALAAAIAATGAVMPAQALEYANGDFRMQMDTTVSAGAAWRVSQIDYRSVGKDNARAATASGHNPSGAEHPDTSSQDNSNLAWKKGSTFSEVVKATIDLELNYKDYGAFVRGRAFYDHRIVNGDGRTFYPAFYPTDANGQATEPNQSDGRSADILDAFIWGNWWLGEMPLNIRAGKQVVSWGEGLFFANGINTINPVDVNALLTPGSELKEALLPVGLVYGSLGLTENLSVEAFFQYEWDNTEIPYCGNYFSTSDTVSSSCQAGFFAGGGDPGSTPLSPFPFPAESFRLPKGQEIEPDDDNQYGIAFRYYIDSIETEVGLYHVRYDSRTPTVGVRMPTAIAAGDLAVLNGQINAFRQGLVGSTLAATGLAGNPLAWDATLSSASLAALYATTFSSLQAGATDFLTSNAGNPATAAAAGQVLNETFLPTLGANGIFYLPYGELVVEYPEDIKLYGISFNSNIDFGLPGGATAVSGEFSYRENMPMQIEDAQVIGAVIGLESDLCNGSPSCYLTNDFGDYVQGYVREEFYQAELAFIHFFDRILGASRWTAVLDMAYNYATIPDKQDILLNGPYVATLSPTNLDLYPDSSSWGYRMRFTGEYSNVFAGVNLKPTISFNHDVSGNSPIGTFLEDRKALGLSLEAEYEHAYTVKLSYTDFYGAEPYNQLADHDFFAISASASF